MSDLSGGTTSGAREGDAGWSGGPPPVLMAALAAAVVIAIGLSALFMRGGGGDDDAGSVPAQAVAASGLASDTPVLLSVAFEGSGEGRVQIAPGDIACSRSCEHEFPAGTRVAVSARPGGGSTFSGWGSACDGTASCSIVMGGARSVSATFDGEQDMLPAPAPAPDADPLCEDPLAGAADPACADDDPALDEVLADAPAASSDCQDNRDNDGDGLTDAAQDPGCTENVTESGRSAPPSTTTTTTTTTTAPPPPPPAPKSECSDGRDNDGDGLTDRAQDPNCTSAADRSESG